MDFFLAFFLNCYALRYWFINSNSISRTEMDELINSDEAMRLCRDICNRSKHLTLNRPASTEPNFSIGREYNPSGDRFFVLYLDSIRDLFDVAMSCIKFWDHFLALQAVRTTQSLRAESGPRIVAPSRFYSASPAAPGPPPWPRRGYRPRPVQARRCGGYPMRASDSQ